LSHDDKGTGETSP